MALVTLQFPLELARGKFGGDNGSVLYPLQGRMVSRNMVIPNNPQSTLQIAWRAIVTAASQAFGTASIAQIAGWAALGAQIVKQDSFDRDYTLNAEQAFMAVNQARLAAGLAVTLDAPVYSLRALPATDGTLEYDATADTLNFVLSPATSVPGFIWARFSNVLPGNARQARVTDVKTISADFADAIVAIPQSPSTDLQFDASVWASPPTAANQRIGVYWQAYDANFVPGQAFLNPSATITTYTP